jgi:hypothetical protein
MLREVAALCGVRSPPKPGEGPLSADEAAKEFEESGFDDEYESLSREDLIEQIFRHDTDGTVVTCAMEQYEADAARARMAQAPKGQLQELLDLSDIKYLLRPMLDLVYKRLKLRLPGSARNSQKRFRDTPMFKFPAVFVRIQPFQR